MLHGTGDVGVARSGVAKASRPQNGQGFRGGMSVSVINAGRREGGSSMSPLIRIRYDDVYLGQLPFLSAAGSVSSIPL